MQELDPSSIEAALARLMPPALSQGCHSEIEAMFDELAGPAPLNTPSIPFYLCWVGFGIAAAIGVLCAVPPFVQKTPELSAEAISLFPTGLVLVSESDRVQSMTDEGWQEGSDGTAMHAVSFNAVEESNLLDEESGMLVQISIPREEILLHPISAF